MARSVDAKPFLHKLLKPDGSVVDYPPAGKAYTLEELQKAVGGYIEVVSLNGGYIMVVNEEGKLHGLLRNQHATALLGSTWDHIVGNALVCQSRGEDIA